MNNQPEKINTIPAVPDNDCSLDDAVLDQVTGGTGLKVSLVGDKTIETCENFSCVWCGCGKTAGKSGHHCEPQGGMDFPDISWFDYTCSNCAKESSCPMAHRRAGVWTGP